MQIRCTHVPSKKVKFNEDDEATTDLKSFELNTV